jgi:hypothetical protein
LSNLLHQKGAVFFAVKDACKSALNSYEPDMSRWMKTSLAVAAAQFPYWLVRNPSEVVKTRQQAGTEGYEVGVSAMEAYKKVASDSGLAGYYIGYWENILYAYPADVIKFVVYDQLSRGRSNLSPAEGAIAGAASTAIAQFLTTPLDVVRNRVMASGKSSEEDADEERAGYLESLVRLGKEEGLEGLFAGSTPRVGKALISGAIQFATYEETKQEIAKLFQKKES